MELNKATSANTAAQEAQTSVDRPALAGPIASQPSAVMADSKASAGTSSVAAPASELKRGLRDLKELSHLPQNRKPDPIRVRPLPSYAKKIMDDGEDIYRTTLDEELAHDFPEEPFHHRWLLTSCIAGFLGSLAIGGLALGFFGETTLPQQANAATKSSKGMDQSASQLMTASLAQPTEVIPERDLEEDFNYPGISSDVLPYGDGKTIVLDSEINQGSEGADENITTISMTPPAEPVDETFKIAAGNSLLDELTNRGVKEDVAKALIASIDPIFPTKQLNSSINFMLTLDRQQDFYGRDAIFPVELSFQPGPKETITVQVDEDGGFVASLDGRSEGVKSQYAQIAQFRTKVRVGSSLYTAAKDNKIPDYIISELVRVFSYDVDFQRQVKPTDTFEVFYGNPLTGSSTKRKVLHYAQLTLDGVQKTYYRYVTKNGQVYYLDENGKSASKALLKTPVSGSRMTSGFGMRNHPLLGYTKMHTGLDFGVPQGTPIRAAGSGVIEQSGRNGAYGLSVEIKHNAKFETLYAHMSKIAPGITPGKSVNQGQIIGYVGSTGRSTGPHLHYEVKVAGRPVNPLRVKVDGSKQLTGKELAVFGTYRQKIMALMKEAPSALQVAENQQ